MQYNFLWLTSYIIFSPQSILECQIYVSNKSIKCGQFLLTFTSERQILSANNLPKEFQST